MVAEMRCNT